MVGLTARVHRPRDASAFLQLLDADSLFRSGPDLTVLTPLVHSSVNTNFSFSILFFFICLFLKPPFYCRDVAEMYDNILHKPLNLRPGVSLTAWSILEELLEKDRQNRLGAKEDFVCTSFSVPSLFIYHLKKNSYFM